MDAPNENVFLTILRSLTGTWNYAHSPSSHTALSNEKIAIGCFASSKWNRFRQHAIASIIIALNTSRLGGRPPRASLSVR